MSFDIEGAQDVEKCYSIESWIRWIWLLDNLCLIYNYSGDLNTELVCYLNDWNVPISKMFCYPSHNLNYKLCSPKFKWLNWSNDYYNLNYWLQIVIFESLQEGQVVVYFDQLSGAAHIQTLVEILFLSCFQPCFVHFNPFSVISNLKSRKNVWKWTKKWSWIS